MIDALIPIGSVVRVADESALAVILGFYPDNGDRMFDYLAAPYPTGLAVTGDVLFLDNDAIVEVVALGYLDEQGRNILAKATEVMSAYERAFVKMGKALEEAGRLGDTDEFSME